MDVTLEQIETGGGTKAWTKPTFQVFEMGVKGNW